MVSAFSYTKALSPSFDFMRVLAEFTGAAG